MVLLNHEAAFLFFQKELSLKGFKTLKVSQECKGRHKVFYCEKGGQLVSFWVKFDKDWFHSFNYQFPAFITQFPQYAGFGESINVEYLEKAIRWNISFLVVINQYEDIYIITVKRLEEFVKEHKLYRFQDRTFNYKSKDFTSHKVAETEQTYSFPIKLLTNWKYIGE